MQTRRLNPWLVALLALALVGVLIVVTAPGSNPVSNNRQPSSAASLDAAMSGARGILAIADQRPSGNETAVMKGALSAANAHLGEKLFLGASEFGSQTILITVDAGRWNQLSDADKNALFASLSSVWAATWQRTHPSKPIQNGEILRLQDQSHRVIRSDMFQRQG